jgi:hypothetical protein
MSQQPAAGQDPDVAVLKEKLQTISENVRDLAKAMTEGMAATNVKLERVTEIALNLTQVQARMEAHSEGLQRSFSAIKDLETTMEMQRADDLKWRERHESTHAMIEKRLNRASGALWAFGVVATIVLGLFIWAINPWFAQITDNTKGQTELQRRVDRIENSAMRTSP